MLPHRLTIAAFTLAALAFSAHSPAVAGSGTPQPAPMVTAQLDLQFLFSSDDQAIIRFLGRQGFTDIKLENRKFTRTRFTACRNGEKYQIDVRPSGEIARQTRIGRCGPQLSIEEARNVLYGAGYVEVLLEPVQGGYQGTACKDGTRSTLFVGAQNDIRQLGAVGDCWRAVTRKDVRALLRREGYRQIEFQDFPPPPFIVSACKRRQRMDVLVSADGRIWRERQIGNCEPPLSADDVVARLGDEGFSRIDLRQSNNSGHRVQACEGDKRVALRLTVFGEVTRKDVIDFCSPAQIDEILNDLEKRGFRRTSVLAEVCQKGRKFRIGLDSHGGQTTRQDIGPCN